MNSKIEFQDRNINMLESICQEITNSQKNEAGLKAEGCIVIGESDGEDDCIIEENDTHVAKTITPQKQNFIKFKENIYDFDLWEMEGQCLITTIIANIYYLYCLDTKAGDLTLIKQEKIELTLPSKQKSEQDSFYAIKFVEFYPDEEKDDVQLALTFAGKSGIIFIVNIENNFDLHYLVGHVSEVYDICPLNTRPEPQWRNLVLSCAKDTSVNLWNIRTKVRIACFREINQVPADGISICCHFSLETFAVSHFDGCLKVWKIDQPVIDKINEARFWKKDPLRFEHVERKKSQNSTMDIHSNTSDHLQYYGDFLVSKDCEGSIFVSQLCKLGVLAIYEVNYKVYEPIWFVKFSLDRQRKLLYVGNDNGEVFFWKLNVHGPSLIATMSLNDKFQIRKVVLTEDCKYLILTTDNGKLWYFPFGEYQSLLS